jgi:E3 ubiquitin-protein ligase synoviolin
MVKLGIYIAFFMMLLMFYGLPIHIIRDLFMTSRDFLKRLSALLRYRRAIQEMNRYPDATQEELAQENTCIICREEMHHWDPDNNPGAVDRVRPKKLPCGHTLHLGCLKSWLERQQVCPTCRSPVSMDRARPGDRRVGLRIQIGGGAQPPQQQQPPQGPAPGPHAPDQALQNQPNAAPPREQGQQQQQDQPPNRPRVFNLGPLRLGFGANGAQLRELAQQFGMPQPQAANDGANAANPPPAPTLNTPIPLSGNNLQDAGNLLQQAELALQRDLQSLEQRQQTIQASQQLLAELQYLRQRQQLVGRSLSGLLTQTASSPNMPAPVSAAAQTPVGFLPPPGAPFQQYPGITGYPGLPARINSPLLGRHGTSGYTTEIPSGSPDLPEGVVLPPGWSLMPLQRLPGAQVPHQLSPQPFPPSSNMEPQDAESFSQSVADIPNTRPGRPHHYATQPSGARPSDFARSNQATEPTPLVSPSPVVPPNWNGQSQLLGNNTQADTVEHLPAANTRQERTVGDEIRERWSQVQVPRVREPESETERPDDPSPAEDTASSSSSSSSSSSPEQSDSDKDKGKGKAVTIEEASDAEDA